MVYVEQKKRILKEIMASSLMAFFQNFIIVALLVCYEYSGIIWVYFMIFFFSFHTHAHSQSEEQSDNRIIDE